jgi:hypothetical protein
VETCDECGYFVVRSDEGVHQLDRNERRAIRSGAQETVTLLLLTVSSLVGRTTSPSIEEQACAN